MTTLTTTMRSEARHWNHETNTNMLAKDQLVIASGAIAHTLGAICSDPRKFYLMGGRFNGSFERLTEAYAKLNGLDEETVFEKFEPHDPAAYDRYCAQREADERLLTYCRENGITMPKD